jgi:uncharacterized CHY-type Zn-finger protein
MDSHTRDLYVRGVAAAKSGDIDEALFYLEWLMRLEPPLQEKIDTYFWLSEIEPDPEKALAYVKDILVLDPSEPRARRKIALAKGEYCKEDEIVADQFQPAKGEVRDARASRFICGRCGGRLSFQPAAQSLICDSCQVITTAKTILPLMADGVPEDDFIANLATAKGHVQPVITQVIHCEGCNASFLISPGVISKNCPYCYSAYVLDMIKEESILIPNGIIPFKVPLKQAMLSFTDWLENHLDMKEVGMIRPMHGMYVPVWTFDIQGLIPWEAVDQKMHSARIIKGEKNIYYDDYLMLATIRVSPVLHAALKAFDLNALLPFHESYVADWPAEIFQISLADASLRVRQEILSLERGEIERTSAQGSRNLHLDSTKMYIEAFRLILLPIWLCEYEIEQHGYKVAINGQTGCVYGTLPKSAKKSWISEFLGI